MMFRQIGLKTGADKIKRNPDIFGIYTDGASYSAEVLAIEAKMPNALAVGELDKIAAIVDPAVANGTWGQIDYFFMFALTDEDNALTSWVGTKTATAINSPTKVVNGFSFNGTTQRIDTNIVAANLTNASQNNISIQCYCYDNRSSTTNAMLMSGGSGNTEMFQGGTNIRYTISDGTTRIYGAAKFLDNTRYGLVREDSANKQSFKDGVQDDTFATASTALFAGSLTVGARVGGSLHLDSTISYISIGGGFNLTNLDSMLDIAETQFSL